jgi:hypothetical protein
MAPDAALPGRLAPARRQRSEIANSRPRTAMMLLLVPLIAWHYRLSNARSAYRQQWAFNWSLEGFIWIRRSSSWSFSACSCGGTRTGSIRFGLCLANRLRSERWR